MLSNLSPMEKPFVPNTRCQVKPFRSDIVLARVRNEVEPLVTSYLDVN